MAKTAVEISGWERAIMAAEKVKERLRRPPPGARRGWCTLRRRRRQRRRRVGRPNRRGRRPQYAQCRSPGPPRRLPVVRAALESVGFIYYHLLDIDTFIDGPQGKPSGGIHLLFAGEKARQDNEHTLPALDESEPPRRISSGQPRSLRAHGVDRLPAQGPGSLLWI